MDQVFAANDAQHIAIVRRGRRRAEISVIFARKSIFVRRLDGVGEGGGLGRRLFFGIGEEKFAGRQRAVAAQRDGLAFGRGRLIAVRRGGGFDRLFAHLDLDRFDKKLLIVLIDAMNVK